MKILLLLALLVSVGVNAQTQGDYNRTMANFQRYYNASEGDSITAMSNFNYDSAGITPMWTNERTAECLKKFGSLKSFTYIGIDRTDHDSVRVYRTVFSKAGAPTTSLTLHQNLKVGNFRFITTSDGIAALLKKRKWGRRK